MGSAVRGTGSAGDLLDGPAAESSLRCPPHPPGGAGDCDRAGQHSWATVRPRPSTNRSSSLPTLAHRRASVLHALHWTRCRRPPRRLAASRIATAVVSSTQSAGSASLHERAETARWWSCRLLLGHLGEPTTDEPLRREVRAPLGSARPAAGQQAHQPLPGVGDGFRLRHRGGVPQLGDVPPSAPCCRLPCCSPLATSITRGCWPACCWLPWPTWMRRGWALCFTGMVSCRTPLA